jgi:putative membrane protein
VLSSLALAPTAFVGGHFGLAFLPLFIIGHVFFFVILVLFIIFAIGGRRRRMARWAAMGGAPWAHGPWGQGHSGAASAEKTLAERFAQGDIDEKEYRARLEVLRANNGPQQPTA